MGFSAALKHMNAAAKKSSLLFHIHRDFRTQGAIDSCNQLSNMAIHDIHRTSNMFIDLDVGRSRDKLKKIADLKIWISGAMTHQETCLDGFIKTPGNVGERMRLILKSSMQLTTNILDMICDITSIFVKAGMKGKSRRNRHLLSLGKFPYWVDSKRRGLIEENSEISSASLVVAKDGSGNYTTINEAIKHAPKHSDKTFVLYIKEGVYEERVQVNSSMINLMMIGDGPTKTKITGHLNVIDGTSTFHSATVAVNADYFIAKDIGFENTAGPEKDQAVALRVSSDKSIFYNCQMDGYQDTLYTHTYRQFYRDCTVSGTIDFVFGDAAAVFQNCTFLVRKPLEKQQNIVTAQGRKNVRQPTGLVLQNCTITADSTLQPVKDKVRSYLARPWKEYSRTIFMESFIDDLIRPEGYLKWNDTFALDTLFYTEFNNRGPGSNKDKRVKWPGIKQLNTDRILHFSVRQFIDGDTWISKTNVPYAWALVYSPPNKYDAPVSPTSMEENADLESGKDKKAYVAPKEEPKKPEAPNSAPTPPPKEKAEAPNSAPTPLPKEPPKEKAEAPDSAPTPPPKEKAEAPDFAPTPSYKDNPAATDSAPTPPSKDKAEAPNSAISKDKTEAPDSATPPSNDEAEAPADSAPTPPSKEEDDAHEMHDEPEAYQPPASEEEYSQAKEPGEDTLDGPDDKGVIFEKEKSFTFTFP